MTRLLDVPCTVAMCTDNQTAKGLCWKHYTRQRKYGDVHYTERSIDPMVRFWSMTDRSGPCWLWTGGINPLGYGVFALPKLDVRAHRWSYQTLVEPVADDHDVHHRCEVRRCVKPQHLEPVEFAVHRREHNARRRAVTDEQIAEIERLRCAGMNQSAIARLMGVSRDAVRKAVLGGYAGQVAK